MAERLDLSFGARDLVIGEAVSLDLPAANIGSRILSGLLDLATMIAALVAFMTLGWALTQGTDDALAQTASVVAFVLAVLVLPTTLETLSRGRSLGKLALGLRTVRDDAGPIQFRQALVRALIGMVEIFALVGMPALLSGLISVRAKRLGDHAAGTYVVRERVRIELPPPAPMPPFLDAWAQGADMAALPSALAVRVREFVARAHRLTPVARDELGRALCHETLQHVAPPPPPAHPEHILSAVLAERRRRDLMRLQRENALRARLLPLDRL